MADDVLTIARLSRWSVNYYNDTANQAQAAAMDRQAANAGLGEYYAEADTRVPTWLVAGDKAAVGALTGLDGAALQGGFADTVVAGRWLDDGVAPNGASGRVFGARSVHGFDLTFAAPKSVSLVRALRVMGDNDTADKKILAAHRAGIEAAMTYLHEHAGYTRVHNPVTGCKDLQKLPGLVGIAYQHETSRCGDPHLHTHVLVPNRQARADGVLVSIDSKSLYHEAKAAGVIYQATVRHELHTALEFEWNPVDEHSGMAEVAGITKDSIRAWSQRSGQLWEWARTHLDAGAGAPSAAQLQTAQKATRPKKPEALPWTQLIEEWRADARGLGLDRAAFEQARQARLATRARGVVADRARLARMVAGIDKAAFTRADLVEMIGAQLPVDVPRDPRTLIEALADRIAVRVSAPREGHHREGHELFTVDAVIAEEERVFEMLDEQNTRTRLDVRDEDLGDLSADQARAIRNIAHSPYLVQPLQAPAGAGKTRSLQALHTAAGRAGKEVLVMAPTGRAVDEAMREQAGDQAMTVAKAMQLLDDNELAITARTVVIVDEASMVGTPDLKKLLEATTAARAKIVLVGDAYQLAPVKKRGGLFEQLCNDLPWSQRLSEVWRIRDPQERDASLGLRSGRGNRLRKAVGWYRNHGRLHTGDQVAMAEDATHAYIAARDAGKDAAILCDRRELADAINTRLQAHYTVPDAPSVAIGRDHQARVGDFLMTTRNDATLAVRPGRNHTGAAQMDQVRNGNRWLVTAVDPEHGRLAATRLTDNARAVFDGDYLKEHVTLGYAGTVHSAQGMTVGGRTMGGTDRPGVCWTILSDKASRAMAYVGMSRARDENHLAIYPAVTSEAHQHRDEAPHAGVQQMQRGTKHHAAALLHTIATTGDDRAHTLHQVAERTDRALLPDTIAHLLNRNDHRKTARAHTWHQHLAQEWARQDALERIARSHSRAQAQSRSRGREQDHGLEL